jgi:putative aldouronate transport system substrate-binding protein
MYDSLKRLVAVAALTLIAFSAFATATQESAMEEPAAFDWLRMYDHSYQDIANEDNPLFEYIEDRFKVDINLVHYHYDVFRQQRDLLVSSGDMADLFAAWDFDLATYGERLVQPYNDRLAAGDLPEFQAVLERNPGAQATLTEADGNLYNFPRFRGYPWIRKAPILRLDLLREGGFTGDTGVMNYDQFKAALQAMSRALDGAPAWLMRDGFTDFMREVPKAFGMNVSGAGANYPVSFDYDSGEYDIITRTPNLEWMILALKDLYDDGLLHPDFHNMAEDVWERHWNDGQVGLTFEWSAWATNNPGKVAKGWDLQFGMALTGPDGSTGHVIPHDPVNLTWGDLLYKDSEVQDEILEMVDWGYSEEGAIFFNLGIEGLHWEADPAYPSGMRFYHVNYEGLEKEAFDAQFQQTIPYQEYGLNSYREHGFQGWFNFLDPAVRFGELHFAAPGQTHAQDMIDRHDEFQANGWMLPPLPLLKFSVDEAEMQSELLAPIQTFVDENVLRFVLGTRPMAEYEDFVQEVEDLGAQALVDLYNAAAARWHAAMS